MGKQEDEIRACPLALPLPLLSLNHVSFVCKSVTASTKFYETVLGFQLVKRPSSFRFEGAWLFNYGIGIGIHLLQCQHPDDVPNKSEINPRDNHISFQCPDILSLEKTLQQMDIKYEKRLVEDEGLYVDQLFFHDPDGYMVEICNCENLPVIPMSRVPASSVRSNSLRFALPQSKPKLAQKAESLSEITLVTMNVATSPPYFPNQKKTTAATGRESRFRSDAQDDKNPYFLDIMAFYL